MPQKKQERKEKSGNGKRGRWYMREEGREEKRRMRKAEERRGMESYSFPDVR